LGSVDWPLVTSLREKGNEVWVLDWPHHHGLNGEAKGYGGVLAHHNSDL
jgi:hypothetical protein